MHMKPISHLAAICLSLAVLLTGCVDQEQKFTVNPDNSGKFESTIIAQVDPQQLAGLGAAGAGKDIGRQILIQLIKGTKGVDLWTNLSHSQTPEGRTKITATGYFPDINKLKMSTGTEQAAGSSALVATRDGDQWVFEIGLPESADEKPAPADTKKTPQQIKAAVQQAQQQWQATKGFLAPMLKEARMQTALTLGGVIKEVRGFTKKDDNTAVLDFDGEKILAAIDKLVMDPQQAEAAAAEGRDLMTRLRDQEALQKVVMESLTDGSGMPKVVATPGEPVFDYKAEVEKARSAQTPETLDILKAAENAGKVVLPPGVQKPQGGGGR